MNATPFYPDVNAHVASGMSTFARPSSLYSAAATSTPSPSSAPTTARGSQEAVGSEFGPPPSILPPSSQRMIPGSGSQGYYYFELSLLLFLFFTISLCLVFKDPPMTGAPAQQPLQLTTRPTGAVTPVSEQRIVTGYARNDPPASVALPSAPSAVQSSQQQEESRINRSPPPPHRSETIGSENPPHNNVSGAGPAVAGSGGADRADDRISSDREHKPHDNRSRAERERDRGAPHSYFFLFNSK